MTTPDNCCVPEKKALVRHALVLEGDNADNDDQEHSNHQDNAINETEVGKVPSESDLETLRAILLGKDYDDLIAFKKNSENSEKYSQSIAEVVSEALTIRSSKDESISTALAPTIQSALTTSITNDPKPIADALYPVMGPAIRKSISEALNQMLSTFNQLLEESFSAKSLLWRFDAWRTGRSYSETILLKTLVFQVEEIFLINSEDGLLLQHASLENIITQDSDMVSGMLTAIQDFINDSFSVAEGANSGLNTLRLGDLTVFIEHGPKAVLAAVVRGRPSEHIRTLLTSTLEEIHHQHASDFRQFQGDSSIFDPAQPLLQRCLQVQKQEKKSSRLPLYIVLGLLSLGLAYWAYSNYQHKQAIQQQELVQQALAEQQQQQWKRIIKTLKDEPGIVVLNSNKGNSDYEIELLTDPLARQPSQVVTHIKADKPISFSTQPYLSVDDEIILLRAQQRLAAPQGVNLSVENTILKVDGKASKDWTHYLHNNWQQITGVQQLNIQSLNSFDANLPQINALKRNIENSKVLFEKGHANIGTDAKKSIEASSNLLAQLIPLAKNSKMSVRISLSGHADGTGNMDTNRKIIKKRIDNVTEALLESGIPRHILHRSKTAQTSLNERSVRYQVELLKNNAL